MTKNKNFRIELTEHNTSSSMKFFKTIKNAEFRDHLENCDYDLNKLADKIRMDSANQITIGKEANVSSSFALL